MSQLIEGNSLDVLKEFPDNYFSSCITDPPYELGFMGKKWDQSGIAYSQELWSNVLRVLKPGAYLLSFGGTRTYHRMACAIEDAGFEIRDCIDWVYGSGFPKSLDISKKLDQMAGAEREVIGKIDKLQSYGQGVNSVYGGGPDKDHEMLITAPATPAAKQWAGWGSALKPAHEPIVLARKPLEEKTIAANVLKWGCGGLNVDGCRVPSADSWTRKQQPGGNLYGPLNQPDSPNARGRNGIAQTGKEVYYSARWPANLIHDGSPEVLAGFPDVGKSTGGIGTKRKNSSWKETGGLFSDGRTNENCAGAGGYGDSGSAARFFMACPWSEEDYIMPFIYTSKASSSEKSGCRHPTIKPLKLIKYLVTLITPPGGIVLDPFLGSGTTSIACNDLGFEWVGIDLDISFATERLNQNKKELSKEKNIMEWK